MVGGWAERYPSLIILYAPSLRNSAPTDRQGCHPFCLDECTGLGNTSYPIDQTMLCRYVGSQHGDGAKQTTTFEHFTIAPFCQCGSRKHGSGSQTCTTSEHVVITPIGQSGSRKHGSGSQTCTKSEHSFITAISQCGSGKFRCID